MSAIDRFDLLDRRIADALEEIAMPRQPEYLNDILRQTARSAQRPALLAHRRFRPMNRISIVAMAAALAAIVLGGAVILNRATVPNSGRPSPSPSPATSPSPLPIAGAATQLWGDWVADPGALGLRDQGPRIQLSVNWDGGTGVWVQTNFVTGTQVFTSDSVAAPAGQLRLRSQQALDGCAAGDIGTYGWTRPGDGLFLTLTLVADACTARSTTFARTWVHTLSAVTDGGLGVLPGDNLELTLPHQRFGLSGLANGAYDTAYNSTPYTEFLAINDPTPFKAPCAAPLQAGTQLTSAANVVTYVKSLPQFTFKSVSATIDGLPATHLTGTPRTGYTCAAGDTGVFFGTDQSWTTAPGNTQPLSVWIVQRGPDAWLFWYRGDQVSASDEATVIGSIHFITALPAP